MFVKRLWNLFSLLIVFSLLLTACGPRPTPTRPHAHTPTPLPPPTAQPPRPPMDIPTAADAAPAVIQQNPAPGAELALEGAIELVFNQPMDRAAVESAFHIQPQVAGSFKWANDQTISFKPAAALPRAGAYQVEVDRTAAAANGAPLNDAYRFRFNTVGYLQVAQVLPAADTQDAEPDSIITVIFNRPVVPLTTLNEQADLPQPLILEPAVAGVGEWLNTSIYVFTPDEPLVGGTTYTAKVAAGLQDTTGGLLADDYVWTFTTRPPVIVWHEPYDNQELVPITQKIVLTFNQPLDAGSVGAALGLVDSGGKRVPGLISVRDEVVTFTPEEDLAFDETYQVQVAAGVLAQGGNVGMAEPYDWRFTTVPLPRILYTRPADGDNDANPYTDFTIYFNTPIDPSTVMPNISMAHPISPSQVYTYYSSWDNSFSFGFGAEPSTEYQVEIGPDIADPYGNLTGQSLTVHFRTRDLDPSVQLRIPDFVGTYNAYDPAQLFVAHQNVSRLDLALYQLSLERFLDLEYDWDWDEFKPEPGELLRGWKRPVESPLNKMEYTPIDLVEGGGKLEPGIYYLTLDAPEVDSSHYWYYGNRHVLIVSHLNLTIKQADDQLLAWATDLASGEPVSGLGLIVYRDDGQPVGNLTTGANGTALATGLPYYQWLVSDKGEPFAMGTGDWNYGLGSWDFGFSGGDWSDDYRVHIYTDRPIYRPDQTVYFRGIVKAEDDASYSPAGVSQVEVTIHDPNWDTVYNQQLPVSEYGAFYGELVLPAGAPLGDYEIEIYFKNDRFAESFQVAAYRAPQFEVRVTPAKDDIVAGESAQVTVEVETFFGSPVANAAVEWNVLVENFNFAGIGSYSYSASDDPWGYYRWWWWDGPMVPPEPILSGNGTTDGQGRLMVEVPADLLAELVAEEGSQSVTVEATVFGPDNSVISGRGELTVHQGDYYIGVAAQERVGRAGEEILVDLITLDWESNRLPGVELTIELYRREYENIFIEHETGGGYWEWEQKDVLIETAAATTDELGEATVGLTPPEGGTYRVLASGTDSGGRTVRSSAFFWATSPESISWRRDNNDRITLITDKLVYSPGETAEILIPSPFEGKQIALITVERADIKHYQIIEMETNSYVYRLPITAGHAPNIYVSAVIIKGQDAANPLADYRVGYAALEVDIGQQELNVSLTPSLEQASPGETAQYDLLVTDASGEPVQGEFSLDVVDKAVLTLRPRTPDAILNAFYGRRALGVNTASGLSVSVNRLVEQQQEEYQEMGYGDETAEEAMLNGEVMMDAEAPMPAAAPMEDRMLKSAAEAPAGVQVREEFADTAYWNPTIVTGRDGRATIKVTLPDNLTTWTARAVGLDADTRVGEGTVELVSTKPLLIRPITPRFFVVDDKVQLAAIVNNNTDTELDVTVSLDMVGLRFDPNFPVSQSPISIPPRSETKVTWWVIAEDVDAGRADLVFSAISDEYADASKPTLATGPDQTIPVYRYTAPEVVGTAGQLTEAGSRTEIIALPPRFDERQGELRVEIDPSLAAGMQAGLDYLEHFEYECVEQTVSRFLPNILTLRALRDLDIRDRELEAKLEEQVAIGLDRLVLWQNGDGGWGWWPSNESNPYLTAYVLFALTTAAEVGYDVRSDAMDRAASFLEGELVAPRELRSHREANRQAWLLFVLVEYGRDEGTNLDDLYQHREKLSHYGRAYLAMALGADDQRVPTLLSDLNNAAILSATGAHWEEADYDWWAMNTDTRSTAIILNALTRLDPENEFIPNVVRWLMVARQEGIWETTQETAWALIALTDWMAYTGELAADYDWGVVLNGDDWTAGTAAATNVDQPIIVTRALAELLREQGNQLVIGRGEGPGRLYYTAHLRAYLPVEDVDAANRGIIVTRQYVMADCEDGVQCLAITEAQVGDEIRVKLTIIAPNSLYYLVVEDPLPAGAEAIDPTLATTSLLAEEPSIQRESDYWWGWWWWNWYSHSELRDEKVVLFADYLAAGTYEYTYTFRATLPGEFRVMPAFASEFYFPEVFGRTEGSLFTITE